ncbi:MAG: FGGY-family carbohydrate kinase, partial [Thioalkalispiraceae bacterium]
PEDDTVFLQGLLEGMAHIEQLGYQRLNELGAPYPRHVVTCGGGAKNQAWNKIRQRYLNIPVSSARQQEAAYGMALLAKQAFFKKDSA